MTRALRLLCALAAVLACSPGQEPVPQEPPEEDAGVAATREYAFNPLQAEKEFKVGVHYARKGSHKAAAMRFREAVKWNPGMAEAWLRLGESLDRLGEKKEARLAYGKYLELDPEGKSARQVRAKLARKP